MLLYTLLATWASAWVILDHIRGMARLYQGVPYHLRLPLLTTNGLFIKPAQNDLVKQLAVLKLERMLRLISSTSGSRLILLAVTMCYITLFDMKEFPGSKFKMKGWLTQRNPSASGNVVQIPVAIWGNQKLHLNEGDSHESINPHSLWYVVADKVFL